MTCAAPNQKFREARERLGLTVDEAAARCGISAPCIWDIESHAAELATCYSAMEIFRFSAALQLPASAFFGDDVAGAPISAVALRDLIQEECRARKIALEQFEDAVGWRLSESMEPPERLLEDLTLDG